jgi:hypothetical protein
LTELDPLARRCLPQPRQLQASDGSNVPRCEVERVKKTGGNLAVGFIDLLGTYRETLLTKVQPVKLTSVAVQGAVAVSPNVFQDTSGSGPSGAHSGLARSKQLAESFLVVAAEYAEH